MHSRRRSGPPVEVYVDTSGFSDLFRASSAREQQLRIDLRASARERRYRYVTSGWTIEELAGLAEHDLPKFRRIVRFVFELIGDELMDDLATLVEREIRLGRPVRGKERMIPRADLVSLRRTWADPERAREISEATREENRKAKVEFREIRDRVWEELAQVSQKDPRAKGDPRLAARLWFEDAEMRIDQWTRSHLAEVLRVAGGDPAWSDEYPLDRVPAIRNGVAGMIARIAFNVGHGRRIGEGDNIDTRHYVTACYADVFVSSDRALGEIVELIPHTPVRPLSMFDFALAYLGWSRH